MNGRPKRGGLGRGLGALIPTSAPDVAIPAVAADESRSEVPDQEPVVESTPDPKGGAVEASPSDQAAARSVLEPGHGRSDQVDEPSGDGLLAVPGVRFVEIPVASVHPNPKQPRQVFDDEALAELTHSIHEVGVLQPIVVRADDQGYELVMGERRLRAATAAGLATVPALIRATADDVMLRDALLENIHRVQLNPLEEAAAYQQLLQEFGSTHEELAQRLGRSRPQISNTVRLLNLSVPVQRRVAAGVLSAGHARALLGLDDKDLQDEIAARIVAEGLSVRATEELVTLAARGHSEKRPTRGSTQRITAPAVTELADKLSDLYDTRVRVELGRRKGKITVEFGSVNDLERLVALMAPTLGPRRAGPEPTD